MQNRDNNMVYEKPKILEEEHIDVRRLVAGCGLLEEVGRWYEPCATHPDSSAPS